VPGRSNTRAFKPADLAVIFGPVALVAIGLALTGAVGLAAMATVKNLRSGGVPAYFTIDAGPHVKVLCAASDAPPAPTGQD